jgi:hypothetical protein
MKFIITESQHKRLYDNKRVLTFPGIEYFGGDWDRFIIWWVRAGKPLIKYVDGNIYEDIEDIEYVKKFRIISLIKTKVNNSPKGYIDSVGNDYMAINRNYLSVPIKLDNIINRNTVVVQLYDNDVSIDEEYDDGDEFYTDSYYLKYEDIPLDDLMKILDAIS